jgi:cytochrome b subunit of formate dehydrogenase
MYSKNFSKFAIMFEKNLKLLSFILTKLLKKPVNLHFTRIYYPYNDSNIFASLIGFMSFFIKFRFISKQIIKKMIFRIRKRRLHRLKFRVIPAVITGINVKLAGRILTARTKRKVQSRTVQ